MSPNWIAGAYNPNVQNKKREQILDKEKDLSPAASISTFLQHSQWRKYCSTDGSIMPNIENMKWVLGRKKNRGGNNGIRDLIVK